MPKRRALIDADSYVYAHAVVNETTWAWDDDVHVQVVDLENAIRTLDAALLADIAAVEADEWTIYLTGEGLGNWRYHVDRSYKTHRARVRPQLYSDLRHHLFIRWGAQSHPFLEADDLVGIAATRPGTETTVIVSLDKDLRQIPGRLYNPKTKEKRVVTLWEADWFHMYQTLVGDPVDGYPGLPGVGEKKARAVLGSPSDLPLSSLWEQVLHEYEVNGYLLDDALIQARLSRICRYDDIHPTTGLVRLWLPPHSYVGAYKT